MSLKSYPVLSPILMDRRYEEGETIDLEDRQVAELVHYGAIGEAIGTATLPKTTLKAAEAIALIATAQSAEEIDAIVGDDQRVSVTAAAAARKAELVG
jgi:hypothetical protein